MDFDVRWRAEARAALDRIFEFDAAEAEFVATTIDRLAANPIAAQLNRGFPPWFQFEGRGRFLYTVPVRFVAGKNIVEILDIGIIDVG